MSTNSKLEDLKSIQVFGVDVPSHDFWKTESSIFLSYLAQKYNFHFGSQGGLEHQEFFIIGSKLYFKEYKKRELLINILNKEKIKFVTIDGKTRQDMGWP